MASVVFEPFTLTALGLGAVSFIAYHTVTLSRLFKHRRRPDQIESRVKTTPVDNRSPKKRNILPGTKVIVRSNEPEPYWIGIVQGYSFDDIPYVAGYPSGETRLVMGIIKPYTALLRRVLDVLPPIEQWNILAHDHAQIKRKYGVEYETYECKCEHCEHLRTLDDN